MPELGLHNTSFLQELQRKKEKNDMTPIAIIYDGKQVGYTYINRGAECVVFRHPLNRKRVISIDHAESLSVKEAKLQYYYHNTFAILFPHNFPAMHASFGSDNQADVTGDVRQRIIPARKKPDTIRYPLKKVRKICREWALPFGQDFNPENTITTKKGEEFYVDTFPVTTRNITEMDNVLVFMKYNDYSEKDIRHVENYIKRMKQLNHINTR